jgi:hypothetical protein
LLEKSPQIVVIGLFIKVQVATVLNVLVEFFRAATAKRFHRSLALLLLDPVVFIIFIPSLETLPRQIAFQKVENYVPN